MNSSACYLLDPLLTAGSVREGRSHERFLCRSLTILRYIQRTKNAAERTRTSTGLPPQAPEACASTNSATAAFWIFDRIASGGVVQAGGGEVV